MLLHQSSGRWRLGLSLSLITAAMWGTLPIAESIALQQLDAYTLTWFRFVVSFGVLAGYLLIFQPTTSKEIRLTLRSGWLTWGLLAVATLGLAFDYLFYLLGLARTSPANAEVLIQLAPVLMSLGAIAIFKERYNRWQWAGVGILTSGFILFFNEQLRSLLTPSSEYLLGSGLIVIAAIAWAAYALAQKQLLQHLPSSIVLLIVYGTCTLIFLPLASLQNLLTLDWLHLAVLVFCSLNTVIAYAAFSESLEHWEASKVSAVTTLTPIVTLICGEVLYQLFPGAIDHQSITVLGVLGAVSVIAGSMVVALGKRHD